MLKHTNETREGEKILMKNIFIAVLFKSSKNIKIGNEKNTVNRICITNPNSILPVTLVSEKRKKSFLHHYHVFLCIS